MLRPLAAFNPKFLGILRPTQAEVLEFDCPACGPTHPLYAPFLNPIDGEPAAPWLGQPVTADEAKEGKGPLGWRREGSTLVDLTLQPSLLYPCWHGWVEGGVVIGIEESMVQGQLPDGKLIALSPAQVRRLRAEGKI